MAKYVVWSTVLILLFGGLLAGVFAVQKKLREVPPCIQPMNMSHKFHVGKLEMKCTDCHDGVATGDSVARPIKANCSACKDDILKGSETAKGEKLLGFLAKEKKGTLKEDEKKFLEYLRKDQTIPWKPLYLLQRDIFFSHRRHVGVAKLKCAECHGKVEEFETFPIYPIRETLLMTNCMDCHDKKKVTNDCATCHK